MIRKKRSADLSVLVVPILLSTHYVSVHTQSDTCTAGTWGIPTAVGPSVVFQMDNRGATGLAGPTGSTTYSASDIGSVSFGNGVNVPSGVQILTITTSGAYKFVAAGAAGKSSSTGAGGAGVVVSSQYILNAGDKLAVLVGQTGSADGNRRTGGGGATFVTKYDSTKQFKNSSAHTLLLVAGGGGGAYEGTPGLSGKVSTKGGVCVGFSDSLAAVDGNAGGMDPTGGEGAYGGAGYVQKSGNPWEYSQPFLSDTAGSTTSWGGFGGGGLPIYGGGGGGGGYSGGQGCGRAGGAGGGSYDFSGHAHDATQYTTWNTADFGTMPVAFSSGYNNGNGFFSIVGPVAGCTDCPANRYCTGGLMIGCSAHSVSAANSGTPDSCICDAQYRMAMATQICMPASCSIQGYYFDNMIGCTACTSGNWCNNSVSTPCGPLATSPAQTTSGYQCTCSQNHYKGVITDNGAPIYYSFDNVNPSTFATSPWKDDFRDTQLFTLPSNAWTEPNTYPGGHFLYPRTNFFTDWLKSDVWPEFKPWNCVRGGCIWLKWGSPAQIGSMACTQQSISLWIYNHYFWTNYHSGAYILQSSWGSIWAYNPEANMIYWNTPVGRIRTIRDAFNHIVVTMDGTTMSVYVNATLKAQGKWYKNWVDQSPVVNVASGNVESILDELVVYPRAISAAEVLDLFNNGVNVPGDGYQCLSTCPAGYLLGDSGCSPCSAGSYCPDSTTILPCPADTYSSAAQAACTSCPAGSISTDGLTCSCSAAYYMADWVANATCVTCPINSFCPQSTSNPLPCQALALAPAGSASWDSCMCANNAVAGQAAHTCRCSDGSISVAKSGGIISLPAAQISSGSFSNVNNAWILFNFVDVVPIMGIGIDGIDTWKRGYPRSLSVQTSNDNMNWETETMFVCEPDIYYGGNTCPQGNGHPDWAKQYNLTSIKNARYLKIYVLTSIGVLESYFWPVLAPYSSCDTCAQGQYCTNGISTQCPGTLTSPAGTTSVDGCTCPANSLRVSDYECVCNDGTMRVNSTTLQGVYTCDVCPVSKLCTGGAWICAAGYYKTGTTCTMCPTDYTSSPGSVNINQCYVNHGVQINASVQFVDPNRNASDFLSGIASSADVVTYDDQIQLFLDNCPAGYYCVQDTTVPVACPAGTFRDTPGAVQLSECLPCPAGMYCPIATSQPSQCPYGYYRGTTGARQPGDCTICDTGNYCPVGSVNPVNCSAGSYRALTGAGAQSDCPVCPAGDFCPLATTTPTPCAAGTFYGNQGAISQNNCLTCPVGNYCPLGSVQPIACAAGTYLGTTGSIASSQCVICPAGNFCPVGSSAPTPCSSGTYRGGTGGASQGDCPICLPGSYCPQTSVTPTACPAGTYLNNTGGQQLADCQACLMGQFCVTGSVVPVDCPVGTFRNVLGATKSSDCFTCPAGEFCPIGSVSPSTCPIGTYMPSSGAVQLSDCVACPAGQFCPLGTVTPQDCPAGTWRSGTNGGDRSSCATCPTGNYCPQKSITPTNCTAGTYLNTPQGAKLADCMQCPTGQYCIQATTNPVNCPAGTYVSTTGSPALTSCVACPAGQYCLEGTTTPTACAAGSYRGTTGARSQADCTVCKTGNYCPANSVNPVNCTAGTYRTLVGATTQADCSPCPQGQYCPLATTTPTLCSAGSFYSTTGAMAQSNCSICPVGNYCPAGSVNPKVCASGTHRDTTGAVQQTDCLLCQPGTYSMVTGRYTACPLCSANYFCPTSVVSTACPLHTTSPPGSYSRLNCICDPGYQCTYYKQITAIVNLNVTYYDFTNNVKGVRTAFLQAMAAAAGVQSSQVIINQVVTNSRRRSLLSVDGTEHKQWSEPSGINVHAVVRGSIRLKNLDKHLNSRHENLHIAHTWTEAHKVTTDTKTTERVMKKLSTKKPELKK